MYSNNNKIMIYNSKIHSHQLITEEEQKKLISFSKKIQNELKLYIKNLNLSNYSQ
jgi:hypothetical protein